MFCRPSIPPTSRDKLFSLFACAWSLCMSLLLMPKEEGGIKSKRASKLPVRVDTHSFCPASGLFPEISDPRESPVGDCRPVTPDAVKLRERGSP